MADYTNASTDHQQNTNAIHEFMKKLLWSGFLPSSASEEGYRYALDILSNYEMDNQTRRDQAALLIQDASKLSGIASFQLRKAR